MKREEDEGWEGARFYVESQSETTIERAIYSKSEE